MKTPTLLLRIGGIINLLIGILHVGFWRLFDWSEELSRLSWENSNIMQMLNLFTIVFFFYTGFVLMFMPSKLLANAAGRSFIGLFATLYLARLGMEFYFPHASIGFASFLAISTLFFVFPLVQTKSLHHANQ